MLCEGGCVNKASKVHDMIKEFNDVERVRHWPVAHPQDARSTLFLTMC